MIGYSEFSVRLAFAIISLIYMLQGCFQTREVDGELNEYILLKTYCSSETFEPCSMWAW